MPNEAHLAQLSPGIFTQQAARIRTMFVVKGDFLGALISVKIDVLPDMRVWMSVSESSRDYLFAALCLIALNIRPKLHLLSEKW